MVYVDVLKAAVGIEGSLSKSEEPCNRMQIYNAQKQHKSEDVHSKDDIIIKF